MVAYNCTEWGKKKIPCGSGKTIRGNPKCKFVWDLDFLRAMELFMERLRRGEKIWALIAEFRAKFKDWKGEPFFASHDLKGNLHDPGHPTSLTMARRWCKHYVRALSRGELPAPFGKPGEAVEVNAGAAYGALKWVGSPGFTLKRHASQHKKARNMDERQTWTAEQWRNWWHDMNTDLPPAEEKALDVESLNAEIKMKVETLKLNGNGSHAG